MHKLGGNIGSLHICGKISVGLAACRLVGSNQTFYLLILLSVQYSLKNAPCIHAGKIIIHDVQDSRLINIPAAIINTPAASGT